jgi:hypothetical protein
MVLRHSKVNQFGERASLYPNAHDFAHSIEHSIPICKDLIFLPAWRGGELRTKSIHSPFPHLKSRHSKNLQYKRKGTVFRETDLSSQARLTCQRHRTSNTLYINTSQNVRVAFSQQTRISKPGINPRRSCGETSRGSRFFPKKSPRHRRFKFDNSLASRLGLDFKNEFEITGTTKTGTTMRKRMTTVIMSFPFSSMYGCT